MWWAKLVKDHIKLGPMFLFDSMDMRKMTTDGCDGKPMGIRKGGNEDSGRQCGYLLHDPTLTPNKRNASSPILVVVGKEKGP